MRVYVSQVCVPAMSTVGIGRGVDSEGNEVVFGGDHRPMVALGEALVDAGEPTAADIAPYQVIKGQTFEEAVAELREDINR